LTPAQFQVYADFARLDQINNETDFSLSNTSSEAGQDGQGNIFINSQHSLTQILRLIDQYGLTEQNKELLLQKIEHMNVQKPSDEDRERLWTYVQKNLETACKNYDSRNPEGVGPIIEVLSLIVRTYKVENFSKKLLTSVFL